MQQAREPPTPLIAIFEQRKDNFLESLQHVLKAIGSDLFIKQMFESKSSEVYVPDRVCEIINHNLNSDREKYIGLLEKRLRSIEACFGKERVKKFEEIGNNMLDHSDKMKRMKNFNPNDTQKLAYLKMIQDEFIQIKNETSDQAGNQFSKEEIKQLKDKIHSINELAKTNSKFFNEAQTKFTNDFKQIFKKLKSAIKDSIFSNDTKINLIKSENETKMKEKSEIERKFSESENQINNLKKQLEAKDDLIKSLQEDQQKNNQQFQLTIQQIGQRDKEISNLQHSISQLPKESDSNLLKQKIATLEADLEFSKSKLYEVSQIKGEKNAMTESLRVIQEDNQKLRNQITEKDFELNSCKQQIKEMRDTFIKIKENIPERKRVTEKIQKLQAKINQLKTINDDQKSRIDELQSAKSQLKQKCEALTNNINEKNELIQKIRESMNDSIHIDSEKSMAISQLKEKIKEYDSAIQLLTKKIKQKKSQCSSLSKENKEIKSQIVEVKEKLKQTKDELNSTYESLQSLKDESKSKDSIIDEFKSSLKKSSLQIRDLNSANMKISEQSSIIDSCEEANHQLMKEISKQEEKIKELTKKFVDCDQNLKKQIQINFAQSKQNDTLSALNAKQEQEINEAHSKLIEMNLRLLKYESDSQTHSDSIKNLTNDNNREISERKLIESYVAKERERFHIEVNNLQKKISEYVVEKTDLTHKLDQISFENKTTKQLLESKEKELNTERQKNAEDLRRIREMTSKVLDENERLKRIIKGLDSTNSQILQDLSDSLNNEISFNDKLNNNNNYSQSNNNNRNNSSSMNYNNINENINYNNKNHNENDNQNSINDNISKINKNNNSIDEEEEEDENNLFDENTKDSDNLVRSIKKERDEMASQLKQINRLLEPEKGTNLIEKLNQIKDENNELKQVHSQLQKICGNDDLLSSVSQMQKQSKSLEMLIPEFDDDNNNNSDTMDSSRNSNSIMNKMSGIREKMNTLEMTKSLLNCDDVNEIPKAIKKLNNDNKQLRSNLESIKKVIPKKKNKSYDYNNSSADEDIVSTITDAFTENKKIKSQLYSPQSPGKSSSHLFEDSNDKIQKMKAESKSFQLIKKSLLNNSNGNYDDMNADDNKSIAKKVVEMQNNEAQLQELLQSDDIVSSVQNVLKENEKLKNDEKSLSKMLNQSTDSLSTSFNLGNKNKSNKDKISELIQQNAELKKTQKAIQNLLPASTQVNTSSFRESNSNSKGNENKDSFSQNLRAYKDQISNLVDENKQLKQEKREVAQLLRPFQNEDDDNESPSTINQILQENKKLKKIQKNACSIIGSNENDFESKVRELADTKKKIELVLPYQDGVNPNTDLQARVVNLRNENEALKQSLESITRLIPKKMRHKNQNVTSPINSKSRFNTESEIDNNTILSLSLLSNSDQNEETIEDVVKNYVEKNDEMNKKMRKIKAMIPGNFNDIEEGIGNLIKENRKLKQDEIKARHAIPPFLAAKIKRKSNNNENKNEIEFEEEEEDVDSSSMDYNENLLTDFPHLIEELAKEAELYKQEIDEVSGILPGNRTDPVIDRLNKLINERNSYEDNENEIKEILSDFSDDDDIISVVKGLANKVRQVMKIIPLRSPKRFSSSMPNSPSGSPYGSPFGSPHHIFGFNSESGSEKGFDFVSSVKRLVNENAQLEGIQKEADDLISENFSQNPNQSLVEKINSLLTSNAIFKSQQERLSKLVFPNSESNPMSIENKIIEILTENQELKQTEAELNKMIPSEKYNKNSLQENVRDILIENEQNASIKENVKKMLNEVMSPQNSGNSSSKNTPRKKSKNSIITSFDFKSDDDDVNDDEFNSPKRNNNDSYFSPNEKIENSVQSIIKKKKQAENEIKQIEKLLPKDNSLPLHEKVQTLVAENKVLKEEKNQLQSLFNVSSEQQQQQQQDNEDDKSTKNGTNKNLLTNVKSALSTVNELKKILPEKNRNKDVVSLPEAFHEIVAENDALRRQKGELESLLKSSGSSSPSNLSSKLHNVLEENVELRKRLNRILSLFPAPQPSNFDDIITKIRLLIENNFEMKQLRLDISRLLKLDSKRNEKQNQLSLNKLENLEKDNLLLQIQNLVDQCQLLKSDREILNKVKSILLDEIRNENEEEGEEDEDDYYNSFSVVDEIQKLLRSNSEYKNFCQPLFDLLRCDSLFELGQKIDDMQKNLQNTSEITQRLFDAIATPSQSSPIRLAFPISEKRKTSLFNLIDSFRKRLLESQQSVEDVIEKARKLGFNGGTNELHSAVQFLEEMSALAERQKLDENFKHEFEELRELNNKQQKFAEQNREKLKKKVQEKVALANEMQEKLAQKEALFIQEVEAEKKKSRQCEIIAEKQKRIVTELIRILSGKGADMDFLKSNLNVSEAVALQYAEPIHEMILKIHNDGHNFI